MQFTKLGNILTRVRKWSPIGEKERTILRLVLHLSKKNYINSSGVPSEVGYWE